MAKWDGILKKKSAYRIIGIAVICLILGPVLGTILNKIMIYEQNPHLIQETSVTNISNAFAQPVSLAKDQKMIIEVSEYYQNSSITIKIISKAYYEQALSTPIAPTGLTGLYFAYTQFGWGTTYATITNSLSLPSTLLYAYIEFMGSYYSGSRLISWPGDYVVIIYGSNSGTATEVLFDVSIKVDGPGSFLFDIFILGGAILLIFYLIAAVIVILRKNFFR